MGYHRKNKTCDIWRLTRSGDNENYGTEPIYTSIDMSIFPASNNILAIYPGEPSMQLYEIFIYDYVTLLNGDKFVETTTSQEWILRGVPRVFDTLRSYFQQCVGEMVIGS